MGLKTNKIIFSDSDTGSTSILSGVTSSSALTQNYNIIASEGHVKDYVDAQILAENLWDRNLNTLTPHNLNDTISADTILVTNITPTNLRMGQTVNTIETTLTNNASRIPTSSAVYTAIPTSVTQLTDVTSAGSGAIITTGERNIVTDAVTKSGTQTITGSKTFSSGIVANGGLTMTNTVNTIETTLTNNVSRIPTSSAVYAAIPTSVTQLSDVTSAGSGAIITTTERTAIGNAVTLNTTQTITGIKTINNYLTIGSRIGIAGTHSLSIGLNNTASSSYTLAQGNNCIASGFFSHAEGDITTAIGIGSHAEGELTTAQGNYSHSEGSTTKAIGLYSHAEGVNTTAASTATHAEGYFTIASGENSHAEGTTTKAIGQYSHAEGGNTTANNAGAHAEGGNTIASGVVSHAEGQGTIASGGISHAEGDSTTASGDFSHAEGKGSIAFGDVSHAGGNNTQALGAYSGTYSGSLNVVQNTGTNGVVIGGSSNVVSHSNSVIVGGIGISSLAIDTVYVPKLETAVDGEGIIMSSPNGTRYKLTVSNVGALVITSV